MKVVVTSATPSLDGIVDPRFGRCAYFLVVETNDMSVKAIENRSNPLGGGAGIQSARLIADQGVQAVLTGNCGPNAHEALTAAGIQVIVGCSGPVASALERFKAGALRPASGPNAVSHAGTGGRWP